MKGVIRVNGRAVGIRVLFAYGTRRRRRAGTENILVNGALKLGLSINVCSSTVAEVGSKTRKPRVLGTVNLSGFKETMARSHAHPC